MAGYYIIHDKKKDVDGKFFFVVVVISYSKVWNVLVFFLSPGFFFFRSGCVHVCVFAFNLIAHKKKLKKGLGRIFCDDIHYHRNTKRIWKGMFWMFVCVCVCISILFHNLDQKKKKKIMALHLGYCWNENFHFFSVSINKQTNKKIHRHEFSLHTKKNCSCDGIILLHKKK